MSTALPKSPQVPGSTMDYPLVDLLEATPRFRIDPEATDTALVFCFSGSRTSGVFADTLEKAELPKSTWDPRCFAHDLFIERFVRDCLKGPRPFLSTKYLVRIVSHPPSDGESVEMRRAILQELVARPELARALDIAHQELLRLRAAMEGTGHVDKWDTHRDQLDSLDALRRLLVQLRDGFSDASSALHRLGHFATQITSGEAFQSLQSLLDYDNKLATMDFRVQIGADGRVRNLELLQVRENHDNPFVTTPLRRWAARLELAARGFRFSEGEVMARLIDAVFEGIRPCLPALLQLLGDLEFYLGALHFRSRAQSVGLEVCLPEFRAPGAPRALHQLFNPLLLGVGIRPIPCSIDTDRFDTTLLITGPNSGGKTRLLQALGLAQLLAQSGLFVPAQSATIAPCPGLVVSLIQETRADQPEGRLGMELLRIRALFEQLPAGAIVILDELCSGTNPSEGEEIFELVVRMLAKLRPQAFITTHFLEFASGLEKHNRIDTLRFLQVALGPNHEPTYQFKQGVASTSLAAQAAARLGVTGDQLLALIDQKLQGVYQGASVASEDSSQEAVAVLAARPRSEVN